MTTFPPDSIWNGGDGSELSPSSNNLIDTEAGLDLTTEASVSLIIDASLSTPKPITVWSVDNSQ